MKKLITLEDLRKNDLIIFEAVMGSNAYGTNTPESDIDLRGVFVQPLSHILKYGFIDQVSDEKSDIVFFEIGRYIQLLQKNDPQSLEMLAVPEDCIVYKSEDFNEIQIKDFLTKKVRYSFAAYAVDQIKKARGYNKKMNWEAAEMKRKTVLDFCYVMVEGGSMPFKSWLASKKHIENKVEIYYTQEMFGLAKIDHAHDIYAMYFLGKNAMVGIVSDEETANDVQLTSIPKNILHSAYLTFNKDAYSSHCIKYKEYQTWLKERNPNRVKMNKEHGKNYDSKNMMHTFRLLTMAHEMAKGELIVRRPLDQIEKLMKIRRGEYEYEDLLREAEEMISTLDEAFKKSTLKKEVDEEFALELLFKIRKDYYQNHNSKI